MAKTKVKVNFNFKTLDQWRKQTNRNLGEFLKKTVVEEVLRGISPVRGQGKYRRYSMSYRDQILKNKLPYSKKRSPVNLKLSGDMLKSIFTKFNKLGFKLGFKSELADIHNRQGAGKSRIIRRILPNKSGEEFNKSIQVDIQKFLEKSRRLLLNKINR